MRRGVATLVCLLVVCGQARITTAAETRTVSQPFIGVTHTRIDTTVPRKLVMNLVEIDLTVPGIGFAVTPSNGSAAGETVGRTTRQFLTEQAVQVAVNGGFSAWVSGSHYAVEGLAARQGVVYSEFQEFRTFALNISQDNVATILRSVSGTGTARSPDVPLYNTLAGEARLLRDGTLIQYANESLQPRTAVGLSADQTRLYLMTIDGRNTGHSLGVTRPELADLMRLNGVHNAINLDGGGSTTLLFADPTPRLVNVPVGVGDVPGTERIVGSNFGVYALPMPVPAAVAIAVTTGTQTQAAAGHPFLPNSLSLAKTGGGMLVLDAGNTFTGPTDVRAGTLRIAKAGALQFSPTSVQDGAVLDVPDGVAPRTPSLTLARGSTLSGSVSLGPAGIAMLEVAAGANLSSAAVAVVTGGTVWAGGSGTLRLGRLAVESGGLFEIGTARVEVAAGGFDAMRLRAAIVAGASGRSGITSAAVEAARAAGRPRAIGWRTEADGAVAFRLAAPGDVDLDGMVDILDVSTLIAADLFDGGGPASWSDGDFNADGAFDILDIGELVGADVFDRGSYDTAGSAAVAVAVPEPTLPTATVVIGACVVAAAWPARRGLRATGS
ncbi:MAG: phosphodiester glycosidase family protein [Planctomycetaceae bacterium]